MTFKKSTPVLALPFSVAEDVHRIQMLLVWEKAPTSLIESVNEFASRNVLLGEACCMRCLKAHLLKKAREEQSSDFISLVHRIIDEEAGHQGYYLDGEEIRKI